MRVLVCGGRNFGDRHAVYSALDEIDTTKGISCIIEGDARGADRMGKDWARSRNIPLETYPADWDKHGKAAGHIRNRQMLVEGKPDLVLAFQGGVGTDNMVTQAVNAGVEVERR